MKKKQKIKDYSNVHPSPPKSFQTGSTKFYQDKIIELKEQNKKQLQAIIGDVNILQKLFPHGHPDFIPKLIEEAKLHSNKNFDYAFGGDPCGNFKRVAIILSLYPGLKLDDPAVVAFIYSLKQIDAYLWIKSNGHKTKSEGKSARLRDISIYSKIIDIIDNEPS